MQSQYVQFGQGTFQIPNDAFPVLAVVGTIEMNEWCVSRQVRGDEMGHCCVLDGLGHRQGFSRMAAAHVHHGLVPRQIHIEGDGKRRQISFRVVAELRQPFQPLPVDQ